ncbi:glycoside hydrolase family 38 C-terminal domain-containing protein [Carnobacteriaceae bacterium 52-44]
MKKVHVVHHTHWDYEWYFTHNESFIQLIYHLDEVIGSLENDVISYYLLDGQMSILDSYLEVFPDKRKVIEKLVKQEKLIIGPWYTQTDELIIRGESIVRNLDLGTHLGNKLGGYFNVGYLPDSFGQGKDMPKIYNGFGMKHSIFWRGVSKLDTKDRDFKWRSEDGSEVVVANIKDGYYVGVNLIGSDDYQGLMDQIEDGSIDEHLLLPVGGDQRYVDYDLRERIDEYNKNLTEKYTLEESTYSQYLDTINEDSLEVLSGEFIAPSVSKIHRSIYSSRYDIKRYNDILERLMIYTVEPLMAMGAYVGIPYKQELLDEIWKLINLNQAHDSAGGCNSDKTNKIIIDRYEKAYQKAYSVRDYLIRKVSESVEDNRENDIYLFNTLPYSQEKVVKLNIATNSPNFEIKAQDQNSIEYDLLETKIENYGSIRKNKEDVDHDKDYYTHDILVEASLPAMSLTKLFIHELEEEKKSSLQATKDNILENKHYKISFEENQFNLFDKVNSKQYDNFVFIEENGDDGDTYDYSPPHHDEILNLLFNTDDYSIVKGNHYQEMVLKGKWTVPYDLEARKNGNKDTEVPYQFTVRLMENSNRIDFKLHIDNKAVEHRMRVVFTSDIKAKVSTADTPFGVINRDVIDPNLDKWEELGWREEPTSIYPMLNYVNIHDQKSSLSVMVKGIKEYQIIGDSFNQVALTLFRSVSYLGKPELIRRPGKASGNEFKYIETPDSQLVGELEFEFSVVLSDHFDEVEVGKEYLSYGVEVPYYQIQNLNVFTSPVRYFVSNELTQPTFQFQDLISLESEKVLFSSFRRARNNEGYELRLFNPSLDQTVDGGQIKLNESIDYTTVNLLGEKLTSDQKSNTIVLGEFKPGEIKTILLSPIKC